MLSGWVVSKGCLVERERELKTGWCVGRELEKGVRWRDDVRLQGAQLRLAPGGRRGRRAAYRVHHRPRRVARVGHGKSPIEDLRWRCRAEELERLTGVRVARLRRGSRSEVRRCQWWSGR